MIKTLCKKVKGNKGFTLIELIVVIAILAILALILVPRFKGFTDDARDAADEATSRTIETAVISLLANGKLTGTGVITITGATDDSPSSTISYGEGLSGNPDDLKKMIGTDIRCVTKSGFTVTVHDNGEVVCVPDNVTVDVPAGGGGG